MKHYQQMILTLAVIPCSKNVLKIPNEAKLGCPKCGATRGYYTKTRIEGMSYTNYDLNGEYKEDSGLAWDSVVEKKEWKWAYCQACEKPIFKIS